MKRQNWATRWRSLATMHCVGSPTRASIARFPPSQLQSVWVSFGAWRADVRAGDRPAAEQHDSAAFRRALSGDGTFRAERLMRLALTLTLCHSRSHEDARARFGWM